VLGQDESVRLDAAVDDDHDDGEDDGEQDEDDEDGGVPLSGALSLMETGLPDVSRYFLTKNLVNFGGYCNGRCW
jgi:hypothetical protein